MRNTPENDEASEEEEQGDGQGSTGCAETGQRGSQDGTADESMKLKPGGCDYFDSVLFADEFISICKRVSRILSRESRLLELPSPVHIFGDLHGNVADLQYFCRKVWPLGMHLTAGKFLFLGDYVDRGYQGIEVLVGHGGGG